MWGLAKSLLRLCGNAAKPSMQIMEALQPGTSFCCCHPVLKGERGGEVAEEAFLCGKFSKPSHSLLLEACLVQQSFVCAHLLWGDKKNYSKISQETILRIAQMCTFQTRDCCFKAKSKVREKKTFTDVFTKTMPITAVRHDSSKTCGLKQGELNKPETL